ncbi:uncharacterized protein LOC122729002 [Dromiciops gliroides]|uniref:uncharacterized protein LOC122729002 n=1 Tax=Dromiciops gliroides TaxID=33562 RepID=UPI001CC5614D|nr:uncharacterized protein LOC122729002 [Dromiciops gliroides]
MAEAAVVLALPCRRQLFFPAPRYFVVSFCWYSTYPAIDSFPALGSLTHSSPDPHLHLHLHLLSSITALFQSISCKRMTTIGQYLNFFTNWIGMLRIQGREPDLFDGKKVSFGDADTSGLLQDLEIKEDEQTKENKEEEIPPCREDNTGKAMELENAHVLKYGRDESDLPKKGKRFWLRRRKQVVRNGKNACDPQSSPNPDLNRRRNWVSSMLKRNQVIPIGVNPNPRREIIPDLNKRIWITSRFGSVNQIPLACENEDPHQAIIRYLYGRPIDDREEFVA